MSYKMKYGYREEKGWKSIVKNMQEGIVKRRVFEEMEGESDSAGSEEERCN